jgi:hypothetical protein
LAALKEYQINSVEMIELGLRNARAESSPFLPSPGQFCEWCKVSPADLGLPSEAEAFREARQEAGRWCQSRQWSHEAVWIAASHTGFFDLKTVSERDSGYRDLRGVFMDKYRAVVKRALNGETFSIPPENRIERVKPKHDPAASEKAANKAMSSIMGMLDE